MDHSTATVTRNGHVMPPGRTSVSRMGQTQGSQGRGGTQDLGGMLVGDDNRLYGAAYPGSPLDVARIRPHSATPAFRPLSASAAGHHQHTHLPGHATNNGNNGSLSNRVTYHGAAAAQLQRANSTPRDRGLLPPSGGAGGGGAGGGAAARSVSVNRGGGAVAATAAPTAPRSSRPAGRSAAQQRIASSLGMSLLDRSLPAVRAAAALEEDLAAVRLKLAEAREEARRAVVAVRKLEGEVQEEREARVRLEDQLAAVSRGGRRAAAAAGAAWVEPSSPGAGTSERRVYTGRASVAATPAAAAGAGDSDGDTGAAAHPTGGSSLSPRARPASASAASTTHLVSSLRWEIRQLTATRDALAAQLAEVKAGSRAQKLQEMQSEVDRYRDEVSRQVGLVRLLSGRLDAAEAEAEEARVAAQWREVQVAEATTGAVPLALPPGNNLSRNTVRSALVVLQRAHKIIMAEARLVKSTFPPLLSLPELRDLAVQRPNTAGAVEALMFITSHLSRLLDEVRGLPGVPRLRGPPTAAEARDAAIAAAAAAGGGGGGGFGSRPSDFSDASKMALPGGSTISSIKAARAAATVRANAIAVAARAAAAAAPGGSTGGAATSSTRHERLGGRLSPSRVTTSRPSSARTRGSPAAAPAAVGGEASRLGRGVLLTPAAGDPVAAEELKERLTEAVAALAAEGRELQADAAAAGEGGEGEVDVDVLAAAEVVSRHDSVRSSRKGTVAGSRPCSAGGDVSEAVAEEPAAGQEVQQQQEVEEEAEELQQRTAPDDDEEEGEAEGGELQKAQAEEAAAEADGTGEEYGGYGADEPAAAAAAEAEAELAVEGEEAVGSAAGEGDVSGVEGEAEGYGYGDEPDGKMGAGGGDGDGGPAADGGGFAGADGDAQEYEGEAAPEEAIGDGAEAAGYGDGDGGDPYGEQAGEEGGEEGGAAAYGEEGGYPGGEDGAEGEGAGASEVQEGGQEGGGGYEAGGEDGEYGY